MAQQFTSRAGQDPCALLRSASPCTFHYGHTGLNILKHRHHAPSILQARSLSMLGFPVQWPLGSGGDLMPPAFWTSPHCLSHHPGNSMKQGLGPAVFYQKAKYKSFIPLMVPAYRKMIDVLMSPRPLYAALLILGVDNTLLWEQFLFCGEISTSLA